MRYAVPWIKARTTAEQRKNLLALIRLAVEAAEQLWRAGVIEDGKGKKEYVNRILRKQGVRLDEEILSEYIEAAVMELRIKQEWGLKGDHEREDDDVFDGSEEPMDMEEPHTDPETGEEILTQG